MHSPSLPYIHTYYRHQGFVARMQKVMFKKIQRNLRAVALVWRSKLSSSPSHVEDQNYHHRRVMLLNKWWQWDLQKVMFEKIRRSLRAVVLVCRSKLSSSPSHAVSNLWTNLSLWSFQFTLLLYSYIHTYYRHQGFVARMQKVMFEKIQRTLRAVALVWRSKLSSSPSHAVEQVVAMRSAESDVWGDSKESSCGSIGLQIKIIIIAESCCK
jgi:hypothetical protein